MAIKTLKNIVQPLLLILLTIGGLVSTLYFNKEVISIRLMELHSKLDTINRVQSKGDYIGLIQKYKLYKNLYKNTVSESELPVSEMKTAFLYIDLQEEVKKKSLTKSSKIILTSVNLLRKLLNKNKIIIKDIEPVNQYIDIAYYYERSKNYYKALEVYEKALQLEQKKSLTRAVILLHQGFCYSLTDRYEDARNKYMNVIHNYEHDNIAVTAFLLLQYIDKFNNEVQKVLQEEDSIEKSKKLYYLIAYKSALQLLDKIEDTTPEEQKEQVLFYKARCLEESGERKEALTLYQDLITSDPDTQYASFSNRRIFFMGHINKKNEDLKKLASENNKLINDPGFESFTRHAHSFELTNEPPTVKSTTMKPLFENKENTIEETEKSESEIEHLTTQYLFSVKKTIEKKEQEKKNEKQKKETKKKEHKKIIIKTTPKTYKEEFVHVYNKKGQITKSNYYGADGKIKYYQIYEYAGFNKVKKILQYDTNNKLLKYFLYNYDIGGKAVLNEYDPEGNLIK